MTKKYTPLSALVLLSLSACATTSPALSDHGATFGQAVKANIAVQHVAPSPEQKANTYIPANRARRALAIKRYEENDVEEPVLPNTNE